ncbi:DNA-3-methyladenine glycosylase I, partial [Streptococcus suis]
RYMWSFTDFTPIVNQVDEQHPVPSKTPLSESISKDMKKRGFKFVGPVCIYSFLQAAGLINDHDNQCDFK